MNAEYVTPMVMTWNEEENIGRCLACLEWAGEVVVVDSGSTDRTLEICAQFRNVRVVHRAFDNFAAQASFGMAQVGTPWVLALDADYILPVDFLAALKAFDSTDKLAASVRFTYCVFGHPLRGTLYPPRFVLHRTQDVTYIRDGHMQRVVVPGESGSLQVKIYHDDRKPIGRWFASQRNYAEQEAEKLLGAGNGELALVDRIRRMGWLAPLLIVFWCLVVKGCLWDGRRGLYYTFQRLTAEVMLSICLLDARLRGEEKP